MDTEAKRAELLQRRDLINFIRVRHAHPGDDHLVGELLSKSFRETYAKKIPDLLTPPERERELRDVKTRREHGVVRVVELGFQLIGTYALIPPTAALSEGWREGAATLRCLAIDPAFHSLKLSERLLTDSVEQARLWSCAGICLHVQSGALGVARLYEQFGFTRDSLGDKLSMGSLIEGYFLKLPSVERAQLA